MQAAIIETSNGTVKLTEIPERSKNERSKYHTRKRQTQNGDKNITANRTMTQYESVCETIISPFAGAAIKAEKPPKNNAERRKLCLNCFSVETAFA